MSYEIVKSIALKQDEKGFWYADVTSATNNVRPHYYTKWKYRAEKDIETKEELQKLILLDFYYGNFYGGKSTKYGKFMDFLGGSWGCFNESSRACKTYHFYDKLKDRVRVNYLENDSTTGYWEHGTPLYERYCNRYYKLKTRQDRELKNALYKEFLEFKPTCKPTIVRFWQDNRPTGYFAFQYKRQRNYINFVDYESATKYTDTNRLAKIKKCAERKGYKVEFIEV